MSGMYWVFVGVSAYCLAYLVGTGVAAVRTGWLPRAVRGPGARPTMWGVGGLLSAVGLGTFLFVGPVSVMRSHHFGVSPVHLYLPLVGMAVNLVGVRLQSRARYRSLTRALAVARSSTPATRAGRTCGRRPSP